MIKVSEAASVQEEIGKYSIEERKCRFPSETIENKASVFNHYTKEGCQYECILEASVKQANCTPWDHIRMDENSPVCTRDHVFVFDIAFRNELLRKECAATCESNCAYVSYQIHKDTIIIGK